MRWRARLERRRAARGQQGYALLIVLVVHLVVFLLLTALVGLTLTTMRVAEGSERADQELRALEGALDAAINQMRYEPHRFAGPCALEPPVERVAELSFPRQGGREVHVELDDCQVAESSLQLTADQVRLTSERGYTGDIPWSSAPWGDVGLNGAALQSERPNLVHIGGEALRFDSSVTARNGAAPLRTPTSGTPAVVVAGEYTQGSQGIGGSAAQPCGVLALPGPARIADFGGTGDPECGSPVEIDPGLTEPEAPFEVTPGNVTIPHAGCVFEVYDIRPGYYDQAAVNELHKRINRNAPGAYSQCGHWRTFHFHPGVYYFDVDELILDQARGYFVFGQPNGWVPRLVEGPDGELVDNPELEGKDVNSEVGVANQPGIRRNPHAELCDRDRSGVTLVLSPRTKFVHRSGRVDMCPAFSPFEGQPPLPAIYQPTSVPTGVDTQHDPLHREFNCNPGNQSSSGRDLVEPPLLGSGSRSDADMFQIPPLPSGQCRNGRTLRVYLDAKDPKPLRNARVLIEGLEPDTPTNLIRNRFTMISVFDGSGNRICTTTAQLGIANGKRNTERWANSVDLMTGSCKEPRPNKTYDPRYPNSQIPNKLDVFGNDNDKYRVNEQALTHESQLDGHLEITEYMTMLLPIVTQSATIDAVRVITNSDDVAAEVEGIGPGGPGADGTWVPAAGASGTDLRAVPAMRAGCEHLLICVVNAPGRTPGEPFVHEMVLEGLDVEIPPAYLAEDIDPHVQALRVLVDLDAMYCPDNPNGSGECSYGSSWVDDIVKDTYFGKEATFRLEIETDRGRRCAVREGYLHSSQVLAFDLSPTSPVPDDDGCDAVFDHYSDLSCSDPGDPGPCTRLRLRVEMPCIRDWFGGAPWRCAANGDERFQVRPPAIRGVRLELETDSYLGERPTSQVTVNATTTEYGDSFNVVGKVWMPRATLDIHWFGDVTEGRPLVTDELVLGALGSRIHAPPSRLGDPNFTAADRYLVCCEERQAPMRHVRLTARTGDRALQAEVLFTDVAPAEGGGSVYEPGYKVEILDWQTCDRGRCVGE